MAQIKRSIDFLPKPTKEQIREEVDKSKNGLYASLLPLAAAVVWVLTMLVNNYMKGKVLAVDQEIVNRKAEIETYQSLRSKQSELVLKVDALREFVTKDFYPQKFFDDVSQIIKQAQDIEVYAYERDSDGTFKIQGRAASYIELAKVMWIFNSRETFTNVLIDSIRYDEDRDRINFEISFMYIDVETEEQISETAGINY